MKRIEVPSHIGESIEYEPETGTLRWREDRGYNKIKGRAINNIDVFGYNTVVFEKRHYKAHRVIFHLMEQEVPEFVDHINGDRSDNRWCNLRVADATQNTTNSKPRSNALQTPKGVDFNKESGKFRARITENKKTRLIGRYLTVEEAAAAYDKEALRVFGDFAKLNNMEIVE